MSSGGSAAGESPPVMEIQIGNVDTNAEEVSEEGKSLQKKSWVSAVSQTPTLTQYNLKISTLNGSSVVPEEVIDDSPLWEDFLVGRFLGTAPHIAKIHMIVNKIWPLGNKSVKIDVYPLDDMAVRFRIRDSTTKARVLRRGMWNIANIPMVISKWSPIIEETQPVIKTMPMWVVLKKVPYSMFSWKGLSFIASKAGAPKRLHPDTELCKKFEEAKVFVEVDLSNDLPRTHCFNLRGEDIEVQLEYPWLPARCSKCSIWGHLANRCSRKETLDIPPQTEPIETSSPLEVNDERSANQAEVAQPAVEKTIAEQAVVATDQAEGETGEASQQTEVTETWSTVSPTKRSRQSEEKIPEKQDSLISPSRFSVLADSEDEETRAEEDGNHEVPELEEGEVMAQANNSENEKRNLKQDTAGTRPSLPRASKPRSGSVAQLFKKKSLGSVSKKVSQ